MRWRPGGPGRRQLFCSGFPARPGGVPLIKDRSGVTWEQGQPPAHDSPGGAICVAVICTWLCCFHSAQKGEVSLQSEQHSSQLFCNLLISSFYISLVWGTGISDFNTKNISGYTGGLMSLSGNLMFNMRVLLSFMFICMLCWCLSCDLTQHNLLLPSHVEQIENFISRHPDAGAGATPRKQALEKVKSNIDWMRRNREEIRLWLDVNVSAWWPHPTPRGRWRRGGRTRIPHYKGGARTSWNIKMKQNTSQRMAPSGSTDEMDFCFGGKNLFP